AELGAARLEDRRRRPGQEPRPVGAPACGLRPPRDRLALGEGPFRRPGQRARRRAGAQRSHPHARAGGPGAAEPTATSAMTAWTSPSPSPPHHSTRLLKTMRHIILDTETTGLEWKKGNRV